MTWGDLSDADQIPVAHDMVAHWKHIHDPLAMRRANPGDDFPSDLLRLQAEGADIADEEIAGVLFSTRFAGHETTSTCMGNESVSPSIQSITCGFEAGCAFLAWEPVADSSDAGPQGLTGSDGSFPEQGLEL